MGIRCAEDPFNMGMFFYHNGWIFRPPTHTSVHLYTGVAPPGRAHTHHTEYHEVLQGNNKSGHQYMASNRARAHTHRTEYHEALQNDNDKSSHNIDFVQTDSHLYYSGDSHMETT